MTEYKGMPHAQSTGACELWLTIQTMDAWVVRILIFRLLLVTLADHPLPPLSPSNASIRKTIPYIPNHFGDAYRGTDAHPKPCKISGYDGGRNLTCSYTTRFSNYTWHQTPRPNILEIWNTERDHLITVSGPGYGVRTFAAVYSLLFQ